MKPEGSSQFSQKLASGTNPEPPESISHFDRIFPKIRIINC
jgi:hypothetical protein